MIYQKATIDFAFIVARHSYKKISRIKIKQNMDGQPQGFSITAFTFYCLNEFKLRTMQKY